MSANACTVIQWVFTLGCIDLYFQIIMTTYFNYTNGLLNYTKKVIASTEIPRRNHFAINLARFGRKLWQNNFNISIVFAISQWSSRSEKYASIGKTRMYSRKNGWFVGLLINWHGMRGFVFRSFGSVKKNSNSFRKMFAIGKSPCLAITRSRYRDES